jgi:hypothetical protein
LSLRDLEKRLSREPDNLSLRVTVAGLMREAGRTSEAVELYRSVAVAYRAHGRTRQAIAVCKSILELAPEDAAIRSLLEELAAEPIRPSASDVPSRATPAELSPPPRTSASEVKRPSFSEETPLPRAVPYHVADPTGRHARPELAVGAPTRASAAESSRPSNTGSVRRTSGPIEREQLPADLAAEIETRQVPLISENELEKISQPPPTLPIEMVDPDEDLVTPPAPLSALRNRRSSFTSAPTGVRETPQTFVHPPTRPSNPRDSHDELAMPRVVTSEPLSNSFFAPVPPSKRDAVLARCVRRSIKAGTTVIRHGETTHPLYLAVAGRLEVRIERSDTTVVVLETIEPGQYIGEGALLARQPSPMQVMAIVDCELLAMPAHVLFELAGAYPTLWSALKDSAEKRSRALERARS